MALIIAALLLILFAINVTLGSLQGQAPLGDVEEAILLFCASIAFGSGVLRLEAAAKRGGAPNQKDNAR